MPLQGAAVRELFALWALELGCCRVLLQEPAVLLSACCLRFGTCCRVPLKGAAVRVLFELFALWSLVAGAAAGCRFRVPLLWSAAHGFFVLSGGSAGVTC